MKTGNVIGKKGLLIGAAVGLFLFAVIGLLPSSFIGGVLGLKIAGHILGNPVGTTVLPRAIVGMTMVLGVFVTAVVFVGGAALTGLLCSNLGLATRNKIAQKLA